MSKEDVLKEVERELGMRARVYPRQIASGKLNDERARKQYARLRQVFRVIDVMTEQEYLDLAARWKSRQDSKGVQAALFN